MKVIIVFLVFVFICVFMVFLKYLPLIIRTFIKAFIYKRFFNNNNKK